MPCLSLVICVRDEPSLVQRLLSRAGDCYDDLLVVHDGPDSKGVRNIVEQYHGRFFERPIQYQQEPHWPFAWETAAHDWILRLDADESPSDEMRQWLVEFRKRPEPAASVSGYTCIWPLWNGKEMVTQRWPAGRIFLFNRQRVRFFGMPEQVPVPDGKYEPVSLILEHRPLRSSYDFRNIFFRKQSYRWRRIIAEALQGKPTDRPCWRWQSEAWPAVWEQMRRHPLGGLLRRMPIDVARVLRDQWRYEKRIFPRAAITGPIHHVLIGFAYWSVRRKQRRNGNGK